MDVISIAARAVQMYAETHPRPSHVNLGQAAELLGVSRPTLSKMIRHGSIRMNACGMIPITEIDAALSTRS